MLRTIFNSEKLNSSVKNWSMQGVTSLSISNVSSEDMTLTISNVDRVIPAYDTAVFFAPPQFEIPGDGSAFDIEFSLKMTSKAGGAILDYRTIKESC